MTAVQVRRAGDVAEIVFSRPEKLNAMDMAWVTGLVDAVADLERDKPAIVVVRGEGRRSAPVWIWTCRPPRACLPGSKTHVQSKG
jgi:enoyl-CoA hydratase/carnithine racemase